MGHAVNPDGTIDYNTPAATSNRLTDEAAGYDAPSAAAMAVAKEFVLIDNSDVYLNGADGQVLVGRGFTQHFALQRAKQMVNAIALFADAFAAQQAAAAVKERDAELIKAIASRSVNERGNNFSMFWNMGIEEAIKVIKGEE